MTEGNAAHIDLFNKQGLMNGERVPIIMAQHQYNLMAETGGKAWFGNGRAMPIMPETKDLDQVLTLPFLTRYQNCTKGVDLCWGKVEKYDNTCWVHRSDVKPYFADRAAGMSARGRAGWHPGWREHRIASRTDAILFLSAFKRAFDIWEEGIKKEGFPLAEKYWHVGGTYEDIRRTFETYVNGEAKGTSECEKGLAPLDLDVICRKGSNGISSFRPINLGDGNGLVGHMKASPSGYLPSSPTKAFYNGPDLFPLSWKIPKGEIDVHAIAIATNYEAPFNEHLFDDNPDDDKVEDAEAGRLLRTKTTQEIDPSLNQVGEDRSLQEVQVVPGEGWGIELPGTDPEYCDGSPQSECRPAGCLVAGTNDRRTTIGGDALSGWIVFTLPEIKNGIIWSRMDVSLFLPQWVFQNYCLFCLIMFHFST